MDITLTLSSDEVDALQSEAQPGEQSADVIHRLISPLVARNVATKFKTLLARFESVPVEKQAQVIAVLESLNFT
jgi:hypothetical protein